MDARTRAPVVARSPVTVREVAFGVDAFYLSGRCSLPLAFWEQLTKSKAAAIDNEGPVPFELGEVTFGVAPMGFGRYAIRLEHQAGYVGVTDSSKLPTLRFQPRAEFLHAIGVPGTVQWFRRVFTPLAGELTVSVSRVDLFADWQGWQPTAEDRFGFLSQAKLRDTHEDDNRLTGFSFGRRR